MHYAVEREVALAQLRDGALAPRELAAYAVLRPRVGAIVRHHCTRCESTQERGQAGHAPLIHAPRCCRFAVMPVGLDSLELVHAAPRDQTGLRVLDVCCGSGVQAAIRAGCL